MTDLATAPSIASGVGRIIRASEYTCKEDYSSAPKNCKRSKISPVHLNFKCKAKVSALLHTTQQHTVTVRWGFP